MRELARKIHGLVAHWTGPRFTLLIDPRLPEGQFIFGRSCRMLLSLVNHQIPSVLLALSTPITRHCLAPIRLLVLSGLQDSTSSTSLLLLLALLDRISLHL